MGICGCDQSWTSQTFVDDMVEQLREKLQDDKVVLGLSGGVDSSVAAVLLHKAIGTNLHCIFVDNGLLRKNEFEGVLESYKDMGLNVKGVNAKDLFYSALKGVTDPEQKRKIIGKTFIDVFDEEAKKITDVKWLAQGTIYPDVIESASVKGPSVTIKSHHNVGGLPEYMKLKIVEPLRTLFKDEVRRVGEQIGLKQDLLGRHPFPGPSLGVRHVGPIERDTLKMLQEADAIVTEELIKADWYHKTWQTFAIFLPVKTVGIKNGQRSYDYVIAIRSVNSVDAVTAEIVQLPWALLDIMMKRIISEVDGVNRVVYDITQKPPGTIEWE